MSDRLETAVVTGGADSTGLAIAKTLAASGFKVHICDVREDVLAATLKSHADFSGTVADVGDQSQVKQLFDDARKELGDVDALINVVGISGPHALIEDMSVEDWDACMRINVSGMVYTIKEVVPTMKSRQRGAIVNFSSGSTKTRVPYRTPYVVSKFAVEGLSLNLARELGPSNIRVNVILPGMINNERMQGIIDRNAASQGITPEEMRNKYTQYISMRCGVDPQELADMVDFLCSEKGRHVTGQLISVDGNIEWES